MDPATLQEVYVLIVLVIAGLLDVVYREIEPLYWYIASKAGALLVLAEASYGASLYGGEYYYMVMVYLLLSLVPVIVVLALYRLCMIGGADVGAIAFIAVTLPLHAGSLVPPIYLIIIYTLAPMAAYSAYIYLARCKGPLIRCLRGPVVVDTRELLVRREYMWWMPSVGGCSIGLYKDEAVFRRYKGLKRRVEASPGNPYVSFIAVAYIIFLFIGDYPMRYLLGVV